MKYWKETGDKICFHDENNIDASSIISFKRNGDEIRIREECEKYIWVWKSKQEAIKALEEAIDWIRGE